MTIVERAIEKLKRQATGEATGPGPVAAGGAAALAETQPAAALPDTGETGVFSGRIVRLDQELLRSRGYLGEPSEDRRLASQYRQIKRPLVAAARAAPEADMADPKLIMVTSALPGDGKTFTALHLAMSMALERDHSVLLVDGDVARPQLSRVLGLEDAPGLLDLLADPARGTRELVLGTDVDGLYLLPAGRPREGAAELLASRRMSQIASELGGAGRRQLVVMDSPPLLVSGEARVLCASAGQVVLVVRSGVTPRGAVTHAIAALGPKRKPRLVLNECRASVGGGYMADGYAGYGYGYGYGEEAEPEERR